MIPEDVNLAKKDCGSLASAVQDERNHILIVWGVRSLKVLPEGTQRSDVIRPLEG